MRTKAYSTRLRFEDDLDEEIILLLDGIDANGDDPGEWLREAARMRIQPEEDIVEREAQSAAAPFSYKTGEDPIDLIVQRVLDSFTDDEKSTYVREAIQMRVAIESHAPSFFVGRLQEQMRMSNRGEVPDDQSLPGLNGDSYQQFEYESDPEPEPYDDGFNLYREALPGLLRLEAVERA
ncbi:hypothetical protein ACFSR7_05725 [Cohnella sp. GCM10020058]|uniref:hypothetical protein n=1 Tax=Cohnella sp. GCM10020058 TaxID=3317330 RepID=UPI00363B31E1